MFWIKVVVGFGLVGGMWLVLAIGIWSLWTGGTRNWGNLVWLAAFLFVVTTTLIAMMWAVRRRGHWSAWGAWPHHTWHGE